MCVCVCRLGAGAGAGAGIWLAAATPPSLPPPPPKSLLPSPLPPPSPPLSPFPHAQNPNVCDKDGDHHEHARVSRPPPTRHWRARGTGARACTRISPSDHSASPNARARASVLLSPHALPIVDPATDADFPTARPILESNANHTASRYARARERPKRGRGRRGRSLCLPSLSLAPAHPAAASLPLPPPITPCKPPNYRPLPARLPSRCVPRSIRGRPMRARP
jgi:hypothetical protein